MPNFAVRGALKSDGFETTMTVDAPDAAAAESKAAAKGLYVAEVKLVPDYGVEPKKLDPLTRTVKDWLDRSDEGVAVLDERQKKVYGTEPEPDVPVVDVHPNLLLADCRDSLRKIAFWVRFFGVMMILSMIGGCWAVMVNLK